MVAVGWGLVFDSCAYTFSGGGGLEAYTRFSFEEDEDGFSSPLLGVIAADSGGVVVCFVLLVFWRLDDWELAFALVLDFGLEAEEEVVGFLLVDDDLAVLVENLLKPLHITQPLSFEISYPWASRHALW